MIAGVIAKKIEITVFMAMKRKKVLKTCRQYKLNISRLTVSLKTLTINILYY